ncbi:hypothetical protein [Actinomycetospora cinnamomea]|uniref:Uncharacterized protein n=1 Tax=Actinomycetospora cinnamomea TaxID=663609 RepID=A0A2U1ECQ2_9PSEU|nr:hypothetical protein [Actinomycetospora cinnamomea]PVY97728.1 hypothetical protein C8D89_12341 [Actinomycetospora cinnamomea]
MTTASVSSAPGSASGTAPDRDVADGLARLRLVLDRELVGVRRHDLELAGRVPDSVRPHVDDTRGMLEFLLDDGAGGVVVLALAPGARGDTVVPLLPAAQPAEPGGHDVSREAPFAEVVGEALEDVSRLLTHLERPDEMRGLVLHLGGQMLMVYADLWELRVTLLP